MTHIIVIVVVTPIARRTVVVIIAIAHAPPLAARSQPTVVVRVGHPTSAVIPPVPRFVEAIRLVAAQPMIPLWVGDPTTAVIPTMPSFIEALRLVAAQTVIVIRIGHSTAWSPTTVTTPIIIVVSLSIPRCHSCLLCPQIPRRSIGDVYGTRKFHESFMLCRLA